MAQRGDDLMASASYSLTLLFPSVLSFSDFLARERPEMTAGPQSSSMEECVLWDPF
jgi:hypothetical protein